MDIGSRATTSEIGKKVIEKGMKPALELYNYGTKEITDNNFKKPLESDITNYANKQA